MTKPGVGSGEDYEAVMRGIVKILEDMLSDWEGFEGAIGPDTRLVADLACSSVEIVELAVTIEDHFDLPDLPFQDLLMTADGNYVDDLRVAELTEFVAEAHQSRSAEREVV
jgi:acyl carrier protein